jgi:hypothetical protein
MSSRSNHVKNTHKYNKCEQVKCDKDFNKQNISNENNKYKCNYCSKTYKHFQSRWTHQQKCKINNNTNDNKNNKDEIEILKNENLEMRKEMENLKELLQNSLKIHPKTLNKINNQLNNNGGIVNNGTMNVQIVQLGHENLSEVLSDNQKINILNRQAMSINDLVEMIHTSNKYSQFKNVYITNILSNIGHKYDEKSKKFIAVNKNDLLNEILESRMFDIETFYNEIHPKMETKKANQIKKFIDRMTNDKDKIKGIKKEEIKLILYNNKDKLIPNKDKLISKEIEI